MKKIDLGQILIICTIILGFSLTLISYFKDSTFVSNYLPIIFWLILLPFGLEAVIASFANIFEKYRNVADVFLIICFVSLCVSISILFSYNVFPNIIFISEYSNIIGFILFVFFIISLGVLNVFAEKYVIDYKSKILTCFYKLSKKAEKGDNIEYIVTVSDDMLTSTMMGDLVNTKIQGYGSRLYGLMDVLNNQIELTEEHIAIVTDSQGKLVEIIKGFENNKNKVIGIITLFTLNEEQKALLKSYNIIECVFD